MTLQAKHHTAIEYLLNRGIPESTIQQLKICWLDYQTATSDRYGYGQLATSPDGLIAFPLSFQEENGKLITAARNFYLTDQSEQQHLAIINRYRLANGHLPISKTPKYLIPTGDRTRDLPFYDPFSLLYPDLNGAMPEPLLCTEDVIGCIKAAARGKRILSSFGVWLCKREELEEYQDDPIWLHPFQGLFPVYLSDSDGLTKVSVFQALVRTGYTVGCRVGMFSPRTGGGKCGLDEGIDDGLDLEAIANSAVDVAEFIYQYLPGVRAALEVEYGRSQGDLKTGQFYRQIIRELARHLGDFSDFKACYGRLFKQLGFNVPDFKKLFWQGRESVGEGLPESETIAELLLKIGSEASYFHTPDRVGYADISANGHRETYPVRSRGFKLWLTGQLYERYGQAANSEALNSSLNVLEAQSIFTGPEYPVFTRLAEFEGKIYLDLGSDEWSAVEITPDGWKLVTDYPVRFRRTAHALCLAVPKPGLSSIELKGKLAEIVNISEDSWVLVLCWLTYCYVCLSCPHPILILHGEQGSGKSFTSRALKSLIDPSKSPLLQEPKELRDLAIACSNRWLLAFDNFSNISNVLSDALCRVSTGGGFATRTLYENDEETVFEFLRPLLINGIDSLATRPDLLERSILITLPAITEETRGKEAELTETFEALKPQLLGALLSAVSQGLAKLPTVKPDRLPRMADFACWAIAVEEALGFEAGSFMEAYGDNRATAHETALEASPVGQAILQFMEYHDDWQGSATDLLVELEKLVDEKTSKRRDWAGTARSLGKALTRLAPELRAFGIEVSKPDRTDKKGSRLWRLEKIGKRTPETSETSETSQDDKWMDV